MRKSITRNEKPFTKGIQKGKSLLSVSHWDESTKNYRNVGMPSLNTKQKKSKKEELDIII